MAKDKRKTASKLKSERVPQILGTEQYRYCSILVAAGTPLDAQRISELYAQRRGETVNYVKTYNQLLGLLTLGAMERQRTKRQVPPHNAVRQITLWQLTPLGKELYLATEKVLRDLVNNGKSDNPSR